MTLVLVSGICLGILQLQPVKDRIANRLVEGFNENYDGTLTIGELDGFLPLNITLKDIKLYSNSTDQLPVFKAERIAARLNARSFLSKRYEVETLNILEPNFVIGSDSAGAFKKAVTKTDQTDSTGSPVLIEVLAPSVLIQEGYVLVRNVKPNRFKKAETDSISIRNINLNMYLEYTQAQRFLDINNISFNSPELEVENATMFGQVYNDNQFLEFNAFNARIGNSGLQFNAEAKGVDMSKPEIWEQIKASQLEVNLEELFVEPRHMEKLYPELPPLKKSVYASLKSEGTLDSLWFDKLQLSMGESAMISYGYITNMETPEKLGYGLELETLVITEDEVQTFSNQLNPKQLDAITQTRVEGLVSGTLNHIKGRVALIGERGKLRLDGEVDFGEHKRFDLNIESDSLDIGKLLVENIASTNLSLKGSASGEGLTFTEGVGNAELKASSGNIQNRDFEEFQISADWEGGYINPVYSITVDSSKLEGDGYIDLRKSLKEISLTGSAEEFNMNTLLVLEGMRPSLVDLKYEISLKGRTLYDLFGQLSLDIPRAYVGGDTLSRHQFYLDFNAPNAPTRSLRLTSTALDATIEGDYDPVDLWTLSKYWGGYFKERINKEILFNDSVKVQTPVLNIEDQSLTLSGRFKNPSLLKAYYPAFPSIQTAARINSSINISPERMLFNGSVSDQEFRYNQYSADTLLAQITGSFRYQNTLKEFSGLQVQATAARFEQGMVEARDFEFYTELDRDSVTIRTDIEQLGEEAFFDIRGEGELRDSLIAFRIDEFNFGTEYYAWENNGAPLFTYGEDQRFTLKNFSFESGSQFVEMKGTFSRNVEDSVDYIIRDLDLSRISAMINKRIEFGGLLNGRFTTRTLTSVPTIQGNIDVKRLSLDQNIVGDVIVNSRYNSELNRFDTEIDISTDSLKYPNYYANNERKGQEFDIKGYIQAPEDGSFPDSDSLYSFDLNFENIDMWILPLIGPKVFQEASGRSNGKGVFWGNLDTYDFNVDFKVGVTDAVYFQPRFLDTYYYGQGEITFSRHQGLDFKDIYLIDPTGGEAILSGNFDFNDFEPLSYMDIRLEMDDFQFLNSEFDPSLPFFGKAFGSSIVTITGSNFAPVLTTETPLIISDFSTIGIPLLEETELTKDSKFIRFVNSFDLADLDGDEEREGKPQNFAGLEDLNPEDLTFAERFTLDLRFLARNPMTVELIFDPVTGDVITANGTGRLRIRLEDQEVSMFGQFDITDGSYQFVSGDIFTRRFELQPGGSIIWEGSPGNARLNLNAVYRARPDINTLTTAKAELNAENSQRVPVELVLNIGGTLSSIENEFFFRLPNTFESRQNSTLATQLNALNRNEDEKLIQATSFLLMDNFIPVSNSGTAQTNTLSENISGSRAVLNPLISNQVISPLLSNQINSLLNSDLSSFDVDFNLNTYNQVDLGVALRLYNDKLILRREGQITGRQSNIGDLGATYRINKTFSVTAFHRQDPTFGTLTSTEESQQSQDINGVGVEATFSFNRWNEFFKRISSPFKKLFGIKKKKEEITENKEGNNPS